MAFSTLLFRGWLPGSTPYLPHCCDTDCCWSPWLSWSGRVAPSTGGLGPRPGTDLIWLSAITKYIVDQGKAKTDFIEQWVNKFDEYKKSLEPFTMEYAAQVTGLPQETLIKVAEEIIAAPSMCVLWAMGVTQHCGGSDTSSAISNLLLATGNYKRPGTGAPPDRAPLAARAW